MRIVGFVTKHDDIRRILDSLPRGPPHRSDTALPRAQLRLGFL